MMRTNSICQKDKTVIWPYLYNYAILQLISRPSRSNEELAGVVTFEIV